MSLIDAARLLAEDGLEHDHPCGGCFSKLYLREPHAADCPLVAALPKIVAALEAAERLTAAWQMPGTSSPIPGSYSGVFVDWKRGQARADAIAEAEAALEAALRGEEAPS